MKIARIIAVILLLVGGCGWTLPFLVSSWPAHLQLPNSEAHGIALDRVGNIYVSSNFYARIQKFSSNGKFLNGFDIPAAHWAGTDFKFEINEKGNLCITSVSMAHSGKDFHYRFIEYDANNTVVNKYEYPRPDDKYCRSVNNMAADVGGTKYFLSGSVFPKVMKLAPGGNSSTLIETPYYIWPFQAPFPAMFFVVCSGVFLLFSKEKAFLIRRASTIISDNIKSRKFVSRLLIIISCVLVFFLSALWGAKSHPFVTIYGLITIAVFLTSIGIISFIGGVLWTKRLYKNHPELKRAASPNTFENRYEMKDKISIAESNDMELQRIRRIIYKAIFFSFLVWIFVFVGGAGILIIIYKF